MNSAKKVFALFLTIITLFTLLCSCASEPTAFPDADEDPKVDTPDKPKGDAKSPLTGLDCKHDESVARPVAFMIDNEVNYFSGNYSNLGICEADIIFETNIESNGSGTRMMAVFSQSALSDEDLVIGGVRSARPYFLQLAKMIDAFYVHEGSSSTDDALPSSVVDPSYYARPMLYNGYVDSYELNFDGKISYRPDEDVYNKLSVVSSAVVVNAANALSHLKKTYSRHEYESETPTDLFRFGTPKLDNAADAHSVRIRFSDANAFYTQSQFTYDKDLGVYVRSQYLYQSSLGFYNNPNPNAITSTDINSGKTLQFENVFVLSTNQYAIDQDYGYSPYHTKIDLIGFEGEGYYFTEGKCVPITWKCDSDTAPIRYYTADGKELTVNCGKTFINLVHQDAFSDLVIEANAA
ncbi:MAG: DUF3048 C-terminal domain-containing protein [Clostridia bacterium]|nr:DUF3048 C-terminal domain-containing protein [Clostridia bacterium]